MTPDIEEVRNKHVGKPCIIAGPGPSLRHLSQEDASACVMIAINAAILKYPKAEYFFSCDPGITLSMAWDYMRSIDCKLILGVSDSGGFGTYDGVINDSYQRGFSEYGRIVYANRKLDCHTAVFRASDKHIIFGHSSSHCACHVAFLMGCSPIILVGLDCGAEEGKFYHYQYEGQEEYADHAVEAYKQYLVPGDTRLYGSFLEIWNRIGEQNPTLEIYNCGNAVIPSIQPAKLKDVIKT